MESGVKTPFCAICGRNHDPQFACASITGFEALDGMGDNFSKEKDSGASFEKLSKKSDKLMILIVILIALFILLSFIVKNI
jgi:hypothetical protein